MKKRLFVDYVASFALLFMMLAFPSCENLGLGGGDQGGNTPKDFDLKASGVVDGCEYVDLGLSVKWATCNIGAYSMEEFGNYYAWGEVTPYDFELTYANYEWSFPPCSPDCVLSSIFDAATEEWGRSWRMPTEDEMKELIKGCNWTWVEDLQGTGVPGYVATSKKNGKSIFLPASQYMDCTTSREPSYKDAVYWTASCFTTAGKLNFQAGSTGPCLKFVSEPGMVAPVEMSIWAMGNGATIRPVVGTPNDYYPDPDDVTNDEMETGRQGFSVSGSKGGYTYVDLGLPSRTMWATYNVGADMPGEYGDYFAWGETSPKELYTDETYIFFGGYSGGKDSRPQMTKYVWDKDYGKTDAKFTLDYEDDAAYVNWGSSWCMPSVQQVQELVELCDFWRKDITVNGKKVIGYVGESKLNGNRIYFPAAGLEYSSTTNSKMSIWYWTNEISRRIPTWADLIMDKDGSLACEDGTSRWQGLSVRPVVRQ